MCIQDVYKLQVPQYISLHFTRFLQESAISSLALQDHPWYLGHNTSMALWEFTIGGVIAILLSKTEVNRAPHVASVWIRRGERMNPH